MLLIAVVDQRVEIVRRLDDDVAAAAAVAAVGAAELDEFLAPERLRARPAVAAFHKDLGLIEKFHGVRPVGKTKGGMRPFPLWHRSMSGMASGFGFRPRRPPRYRSDRRSRYGTPPRRRRWRRGCGRGPSRHCSPAWNLVPRWRTRMLPEMTAWPPNFLTPRRRPVGIAPVARGTACFLMRHGETPLRTGADVGHAQHRLGLAMAVLAAIIVPAPLLENDDLVGLALLDDFRRDGGALEGRADLGVAAVARPSAPRRG